MQSDMRLLNDHSEIDRLFSVAFDTLERGEDPFEIVDRIWARLAVHIRAEHLHLFPMINTAAEQHGNLQTTETLSKLRADHNFFMNQFGLLIKDLRAGSSERVKDVLEEISRRLNTHNEIEESQIYALVDEWLSVADAETLQAKIGSELDNAPPRFSVN
jgi:hemerythrin superfamily protein